MPSTKIKIDMALVVGAGVLWCTVGIGVRLIETANVWQILLYRSFSLSLFLLLIISCLKKSNPFKALFNTRYAGLIGGVALLAVYSGGFIQFRKFQWQTHCCYLLLPRFLRPCLEDSFYAKRSVVKRGLRLALP